MQMLVVRIYREPQSGCSLGETAGLNDKRSRCEELELYGRMKVIVTSQVNVVIYCHPRKEYGTCLHLLEIMGDLMVLPIKQSHRILYS